MVNMEIMKNWHTLLISTFMWISLPIYGQVGKADIDELKLNIFPENRSEDSKIPFRGCISLNDSLILYVRRNQPNIEVANNLLEKIANKQDRTVLPQLHDIAQQHIKIFKDEWACALRQHPKCQALLEQLNLLHALETSLVSFRLDSLYPDPLEKYNYWKSMSDLFYINMYKNNSRFEKYMSEEFKVELSNFSNDKLAHLQKNSISVIPYYSEIATEKNAFGGNTITWSYMTPFLEEIKPIFLKELEDFQQLGPNNSFHYALKKNFFMQFVKTNDFKILTSK